MTPVYVFNVNKTCWYYIIILIIMFFFFLWCRPMCADNKKIRFVPINIIIFVPYPIKITRLVLSTWFEINFILLLLDLSHRRIVHYIWIPSVITMLKKIYKKYYVVTESRGARCSDESYCYIYTEGWEGEGEGRFNIKSFVWPAWAVKPVPQCV